MFNKVILVGNLTRDIEIRYLPSGQALAKTAIATNRKYKVNGEQKDEVCFIDITFWGRSAEIANQYLRRGSKILVEGRLSFEQWTNQEGKKQSKHSVIVESMQMLPKSDSNDSVDYNSQAPKEQPERETQAPRQTQQQSYQKPTYANEPEKIPEIDINDEEIPF
jgi:single-strand DNA-binding protein